MKLFENRIGKKSLRKSLFGLFIATGIIFSFAACVPEAPETPGNEPEQKDPEGGNKGNSYTPKYNVGDFIFKDGSKLSFEDMVKGNTSPARAKEPNLFEDEGIAIIFKADTENSPALGMSPDFWANGNSWCGTNAGAYTKRIPFIECPYTGTDYNIVFDENGDKDGSDNIQQISYYLGHNGGDLYASSRVDLPQDDTGLNIQNLQTPFNPSNIISGNYPAFYTASNNIKNTSDTNYETGWYLPTISELYDILKANKDSICDDAPDGVINYALSKINTRMTLFDKYFNSSTPNEKTPTYNYAIKGNKETVAIQCIEKASVFDDYVFGIRAFE